jgi:chromosome partitioning protein
MPRKIITVGSTKGGVGKTTLALNIAIGLALRGHSVWMIDCEEPAGAARALDQRRAAGQRPTLVASHHPAGAVLRTQVMHQLDRYQHIVIDAGSNQAALRTALLLSDAVVVPVPPRTIDLWALPDIASMIEGARSMRDGLEALAVLNLADSCGAENAQAAQAVGRCPGLKFVDAPIGRRKSISTAAGLGLSVLERQPRDVKASAEIDALLCALFGAHEQPRTLADQSAYSPLYSEPIGAFQPVPG